MDIDTLDKSYSGIYKITQKNTGKVYIGSSVDIYVRRRDHKYQLINGNHPNSELQKDTDKFG